MLKEKTILEENTLIAEFMGYSERQVGSEWEWDFNPLKNDHEPLGLPIIGRAIDNLEFHESWDWLMPVLEKINNLKSRETNLLDCIDRNLCDINIENTYSSAISFIKWYNANN